MIPEYLTKEAKCSIYLVIANQGKEILQIMLNTSSVNPIWRDPFKHPGPNHNVVVHWPML